MLPVLAKVAAAVQGDGGALNHRAAGHAVGGFLAQVDDRYEHGFAVHLFADQPHHVLREARHLVGRECDADGEMELLRLVDAGIHQGFVLLQCVAVAVEVTAAGEAGELVHDQLRTLSSSTRLYLLAIQISSIQAARLGQDSWVGPLCDQKRTEPSGTRQ
ncbi:hypothetical protein [Dyella sp. M7H15-1]|uniref:hypothetical protein n=1 Tax=Dyella sp. M7H15-1 TaxID=2501295 RepID=UPI0013E8AC6A|nr:hypothetical protein [Dyella sp. M7H15-1]